MGINKLDGIEHGDVVELLNLSDYDLLEGLKKAVEALDYDLYGGTRVPVLDGSEGRIDLDAVSVLRKARPPEKR